MIGAYLHSTFAMAGPWVLTMIALAVTSFVHGDQPTQELMNLRGVLAYNFSFSLVFSAPALMIIARYIADHIHLKNVISIPSAILQSLMLVFVCNIGIAVFLYGFYFHLPMALCLAAFAHIFLLSGVWLLSVCLIALKDLRAVVSIYAIGVVAALVCMLCFGQQDAARLMLCHDIGLTIILFLLAGRVFSEYPYHLTREFRFAPFWKKYWELAAGGFFLNCALWVDKWIMWFAPESLELNTKVRFLPEYDSAMFLAAVTILPGLVLLAFSLIPHFLQHYRRFHDAILNHATMKKIRHFHEGIIDSVAESLRSLGLLQGVIAIVLVLGAPQILERLHLFMIQSSMFQLGTLASLFTALILFSTAILSYLDCRRALMYIFAFYFVSNALLTIFFMQKGYAFYGYGFFMASMLTFLLCAGIVVLHIWKLPYHSFITHNRFVNPASPVPSQDHLGHSVDFTLGAENSARSGTNTP